MAKSKYFINPAWIFTVKIQASRSTSPSEQQARWAWHLVVLQQGVLGCLPLHDWQKGWCIGGVILQEGEYTPLIIQILWHLARMECEELRRVPETTEKQKLEHVRRTRIDTVWSPFRLKPCPGSNHSATEWRRKSFPDSSVLSQADMARGFRAYNANLTPVPLQGLSLCRFREAPSLKSHFLLCSCAQHGLGVRNSALDSLHRGAVLITQLRPLCLTTVWAHKAPAYCLGWSLTQLWDAGVPALKKLYLQTTNNGHSKKVWSERNKLASNYL